MFWVEPVLLNRSMVLATVLQLSFWVLAIQSYSQSHLYVEQQLLFVRSSERSFPWGAMLNFQWSVWESESDNTKFNTPAPHSHLRPCNTNHWCHMDCFTDVLTTFLDLGTLLFHQKFLNLSSEDEQTSYGFGTTWGWVINYTIFILGWTNPLNALFTDLKHSVCLKKYWVNILWPEKKLCIGLLKLFM